jgi:PAS domain S-box-containing protein
MSLSATDLLLPEPWETKPQRAQRALHVAVAANKSLSIAPDVVAWLRRVCRTVVQAGGYPMAWVGFAERNPEKTVRPVAHAGVDATFIKTANITWKDEPRGRGPAGIAIRTGKHCVARDVPNDPAFHPWRREASQRGFKSAIALPLSSEGRSFGVLATFAKAVDAFGRKEVDVLSEVANNLAHGLIVALRTGAQQRSAADALQESQRKLGQVERMFQFAHWDRDLTTNVLTWSDELYRIFGLEPKKRILRFSDFTKLVHPDDRAGVHETVAAAERGTGRFSLDFRIIRPDGQLRYLHSEGEVMPDDAGRPRRTIGFTQDVTEQQLAKVALETANRSLETKNIALHEVLADIETERHKIGRRVNKNVEEIILPLLQSLRLGATHQQQRAIDQIDNCLDEITSPFIDEVAHAARGLTPAEHRLCSFIKRGLGVKQIAELEHLSPATISAHRRSIRRKLHITNQKINLVAHLQEVFRDPPVHDR